MNIVSPVIKERVHFECDYAYAAIQLACDSFGMMKKGRNTNRFIDYINLRIVPRGEEISNPNVITQKTGPLRNGLYASSERSEVVRNSKITYDQYDKIMKPYKQCLHLLNIIFQWNLKDKGYTHEIAADCEISSLPISIFGDEATVRRLRMLKCIIANEYRELDAF